jgi:hypothetical protein
MARSQAALDPGRCHGGSDDGLCHSGESLRDLAPDRACQSEHVASRRVAEHIGMRAERTALLDGDCPAVVYAAKLHGRRTRSVASAAQARCQLV